MEYRMISPEAALAVKQYLIPGTAENPHFSEFFFYAAIQEDGGLAGLLAIDPIDMGAMIVSVGMSPSCCDKGYGSELLRYACRDLSAKLQETSRDFITLRVGFSVKRDRGDRLSSFFRKNGFFMEDESPVYRIPLSKAAEAPVLKDAAKKEKPEGLLLLKDVSQATVNVFSNKVLHEGLYPAIRRQGLDEEVSVCFMPGKEILGCALFEKATQGILQNVWIYVSNEASAANRMIFLLMMAECLRQALKKYQDETEICILAVEDVSKELLQKIFPKEQPSYMIQSHLRLVAADADMDDEEQDDPVFEEVLPA